MQWRWINKKIPNCNHRNSKRNNLVISKKISLSPIRLAFVKISRVPKKACLNGNLRHFSRLCSSCKYLYVAQPFCFIFGLKFMFFILANNYYFLPQFHLFKHF